MCVIEKFSSARSPRLGGIFHEVRPGDSQNALRQGSGRRPVAPASRLRTMRDNFGDATCRYRPPRAGR